MFQVAFAYIFCMFERALAVAIWAFQDLPLLRALAFQLFKSACQAAEQGDDRFGGYALGELFLPA